MTAKITPPQIDAKLPKEVDLKELHQNKIDSNKTLGVGGQPLDPVEQYLATLDMNGREVFKLRAMAIPRSKRIYETEWLLGFQEYNIVPRPFIFIPPGKYFDIHKTLKLAHRAKDKGRTLKQAIEAEKLGMIKIPETPDSVREGRRYKTPSTTVDHSPLNSPLRARGKPKANDYVDKVALPIFQNPSGPIEDEPIPFPDIQTSRNNEQADVTDSNAYESGRVENLVNVLVPDTIQELGHLLLAVGMIKRGRKEDVLIVETMELMETVVMNVQENVKEVELFLKDAISQSHDIA